MPTRAQDIEIAEPIGRLLALSAILLTLATFSGGPAWAGPALTPKEVFIVANANSDESSELARHYARRRGMPPRHIALLDTTTDYLIGRKDYEQQIRNPLRQILLERKLVRRIRCVVLMWGMPVQVLGKGQRDLSPQQKAYRLGASKAHYRLAINRKLLVTVCRQFPEPGTEKLKPLGKLFASPAPVPRRPLMKFKALPKDINLMLTEKQRQFAHIRNSRNRQIAIQQLMALHLDIGGLKGLISFIEAENPSGAPDVNYLRQLLAAAESQLAQLDKAAETVENIQARLKLTDNVGGALFVYSFAAGRGGRPPGTTTKSRDEARAIVLQTAEDASLDSELALIWWPDYPLAGPFRLSETYINPLHWRVKFGTQEVPPTLMTARIDGPSQADAMRIIDDSLAAEKVGLRGKFYIDAGGKAPEYDAHLRLLYGVVSTHTNLQVVFDEAKLVFQPGTCRDAALYVGWYSLRKYIPAFTWTRGAVGWHISSFEAQDLRNPNSQKWCVKMIQNGVVATIGAVQEPLLAAFPIPEEFFPLLLTGQYTLAECYWRTVPWASWRMTLIGDPLYRPFAVNPQMRVDQLPKGLAP